MSNPYIGEIRIFGHNFAQRRWAFCNGQVLAIAQNTALFSILGTTFGGNGTQTFGLPNFQDRAAMHWGTGPGLSNRVLGESGGEASHTLLSTEMPSHGHTLNVATVAEGLADRSNANGNVLAKPVDSSYLAAASNTTLHPGSVTGTGGGVPHNNMQPFLALNFCIAQQGIFPARN